MGLQRAVRLDPKYWPVTLSFGADGPRHLPCRYFASVAMVSPIV